MSGSTVPAAARGRSLSGWCGASGTWEGEEPACGTRAVTEQDEQAARPRALSTARAYWWAVSHLRRGYASAGGIAGRPGTTRSRADGPPRRSSPRCPPARSPKSGGTARPSGSGARRSRPASTPAAPATTGRRRQTASSSSTTASPPASTTKTTTSYTRPSSAADRPTPTPGRKSPFGPLVEHLPSGNSPQFFCRG